MYTFPLLLLFYSLVLASRVEYEEVPACPDLDTCYFKYPAFLTGPWYDCTTRKCPINLLCCQHCRFHHPVCVAPISIRLPKKKNAESKNTCPKRRNCIETTKRYLKDECHSNRDCPESFECCLDSCSQKKICQKIYENEENKLCEFVDTKCNRFIPFPYKKTKFLECSNDNDCNNNEICCSDACYMHRICKMKTKEYVPECPPPTKSEFCIGGKKDKVFTAYKCTSDKDCSFGDKCCEVGCYQHKVCTKPSNVFNYEAPKEKRKLEILPVTEECPKVEAKCRKPYSLRLANRFKCSADSDCAKDEICCPDTCVKYFKICKKGKRKHKKDMKGTSPETEDMTTIRYDKELTLLAPIDIRIIIGEEESKTEVSSTPKLSTSTNTEDILVSSSGSQPADRTNDGNIFSDTVTTFGTKEVAMDTENEFVTRISEVEKAFGKEEDFTTQTKEPTSDSELSTFEDMEDFFGSSFGSGSGEWSDDEDILDRPISSATSKEKEGKVTDNEIIYNKTISAVTHAKGDTSGIVIEFPTASKKEDTDKITFADDENLTSRDESKSFSKASTFVDMEDFLGSGSGSGSGSGDWDDMNSKTVSTVIYAGEDTLRMSTEFITEQYSTQPYFTTTTPDGANLGSGSGESSGNILSSDFDFGSGSGDSAERIPSTDFNSRVKIPARDSYFGSGSGEPLSKESVITNVNQDVLNKTSSSVVLIEPEYILVR